MGFKTRQRQRPIKNGRISLPSCVIPDINRAVEHTANRFNVSKSWVVAVACAEFFGIKKQERWK